MIVGSAKKTSLITFRLNEDTTAKLRNASKNKDVSTNTLVNQALKQFLDWYVFQPYIGLVSINKYVFTRIFEDLTEKEVVKLASTIGKDEICSMSFFMRGKMDITSFMSWFEMLMVCSSVKVNHVSDAGMHSYVMRHDLGRNMSLYYKTILELVFEELLGKRICVEHDKSMFRFQFSE